jgi:microcin C transport system substrate-binding protein
MGSGAYKIKNINAGRSITYERVQDYWAKDLPVNRGRYNFDIVQYDYYRDTTVAVEALKSGEYDFRRENIARTWANAYNIEQVKDGRMVKETLPDGTPTGMQCFAFNTRRPDFKNVKVREAIAYAFDFEWSNKQLFFDAYTRNRSYFGNSEFEAKGLPSKEELALFEEFKNQESKKIESKTDKNSNKLDSDILDPRIFTAEYNPPETDGSGNTRPNLINAKQLLDEAGWRIKDFKLINPETGKAVKMEFLLYEPTFERVIAPFIKNLKKLGIDARIRVVDSSQYIKRIEDYDFDITVNWFTEGSSPGNEQINYWTSKQADIKGSRNLIGIKNPAVDFLVEKLVKAKNKQEQIASAHALDRVLQWNFYAIPQWYSRSHRVIYRNKLGRPANTPPFSLGMVDTWWVK